MVIAILVAFVAIAEAILHKIQCSTFCIAVILIPRLGHTTLFVIGIGLPEHQVILAVYYGVCILFGHLSGVVVLVAELLHIRCLLSMLGEVQFLCRHVIV